jgi:DNA-binding transcriptional ArsR family regulator
MPASGAILKQMLDQQAPLDRLFHALADPTRMRMVERLCRSPASVSELAQPLAMSMSAVMQHLDVLQASGLVRSEKVGRVRTFHIETTGLRTAERWITERRTSWERRLDRLGDFLAELPEEQPEHKE